MVRETRRPSRHLDDEHKHCNFRDNAKELQGLIKIALAYRVAVGIGAAFKVFAFLMHWHATNLAVVVMALSSTRTTTGSAD